MAEQHTPTDEEAAFDSLAEAVRALTNTLEYEWEGDFKAEIVALNQAFMRFDITRRRAPDVAREDRVTAYQEDGLFCVTYRTPILQRAKHIHGQVEQFVSLMDDEPSRSAPTAPDIFTAAQSLLDAVDARQDNCVPPLKYTIPYGAVNDLRAAIATTQPKESP